MLADRKIQVSNSNSPQRTHLFVSPHMDDAIGSCGGTIAKLISMGEQVKILTLFSGAIKPPYSPMAIDLHEQWGNPRDIIGLRRAEDRAACTVLGTELHFEDIPDSLYRLTKGGNWMYGNDDDIFRNRHPEDNRLVPYFVQRIHTYLTHIETRIYIPLGIGNHVDHLIAFDVGYLLKSNGVTVWFYEDFPYATRQELYEQRTKQLKGWYTHLEALVDQNIQLKIRAFQHYQSQIPMLFGTINNAIEAIYNFASSYGGDNCKYAEQYWTY